MASGTRRLLEVAGADAGAFHASALTADHLASADLVVTAAKEHRSAGARLCIPALSRILTLTDLADLLHGVTPHEVASLGGSGSWVRQVVAAATARRAVVPARQGGVDITDPIGGPPSLFEQMAREVEAVLPAIATVLRGHGTTT